MSSRRRTSPSASPSGAGSGRRTTPRSIPAARSVGGTDLKVLALGTVNDVSLFRDLLAAGASDYLVKPLTFVNVTGPLVARVAEAYPRLRSSAPRRLMGSGHSGGYAAGQRADLGTARVGARSQRRLSGG